MLLLHGLLANSEAGSRGGKKNPAWAAHCRNVAAPGEDVWVGGAASAGARANRPGFRSVGVRPDGQGSSAGIPPRPIRLRGAEGTYVAFRHRQHRGVGRTTPFDVCENLPKP